MTTKTETIHPSEIALLEAHDRLERKMGKAPSLQDLLDELGHYSDRSGVNACLQRCIQHELIKPATARQITPKGRLAMSRGIKACIEGESTRLKSRSKSR